MPARALTALANRRSDVVEYDELKRRVREIVANRVPPGLVLVASKGDDELLAFDDRRGAHFPQDPRGGYAGHHPRDSAEATKHLEQLRDKGARFLLIPSTAFWWFSHYEEFGERLERDYPVVAREDDTCIVFALDAAPANRREARDGSAGNNEVVRQLRALVRSLVGEAVNVGVVNSGASRLLAIGPSTAFPAGGGEALDRLLSADEPVVRGELRRLQATGVQYLVVPAEARRRVDQSPGMRAALDAWARPITRQRHVGDVFELLLDEAAPSVADEPAKPSAGRNAPGTDPKPADTWGATVRRLLGFDKPKRVRQG